MRRIPTVLILLVALLCVAADKQRNKQSQSLADHLQAISVTIRAGGSEGSGVTVYRDGVTYVWTAGHVVDGLRSTREVVDPRTGTKRTLVEFRDPTIVRILIEDGRRVGQVEMDASVIRYSDPDHGEDLALLRVRKKDFIRDSAAFYLEDVLLPLGTPLFHVGSLLGEQGSNSMTSGIVSQHGRIVGKKEFLQTTVTAFPGSSGGGVYRASDGLYIGMLVRGAGEQFNLCIPIQRMRRWAKEADIQWALDPAVKMPSRQELDDMPIEDIGVTFKERSANSKAVDFLLFHPGDGTTAPERVSGEPEWE